MTKINTYVKKIALLAVTMMVWQAGLFAQQTPGPSTSGYCDGTVPSFIVDLSSNSDSVWIETQQARLDSCCHQEDKDPCIEFVVSLHASIGGLYFSVESPAPSISASQFYINCDHGPFSVQDTVCVEGITPPYTITYCKPGNDKPDYIISGIGFAEVSPPIVVSNACVDTISAEGFVESSIVWNSVYPGAYGDYNGLLTDPQGNYTNLAEDTMIVIPAGTPPDSIGYEVCGQLSGFNCSSGISTKCDTTWVYFVTDFSVSITPQNPSICNGSTTGVTLTSNPTGGASPYTFLWSNGATTQSIVVNSGQAGQYWVQAYDTLECGEVTDVVTVTEYTVDILANAGVDDTVCISTPTLTLNGTLQGASEGIWTGGLGVFSPDASTANATYTLHADEVTAGSVTLTWATQNTGTCPGDSDDMVVVVEPEPSVTMSANAAICASQTTYTISGTASADGTVSWSTSGNGTFDNNLSENPIYTVGSSDVTNQSVYLIKSVTNNGCGTVKDSILLTINPLPTVNAGPDREVCSGSSVQIGGSPTASGNGPFTYTWSGTALDNYSTANPNSSATVSTIYNLTVTDNNGCVRKDNINVSVTPRPTVNASNNIEICSSNSSVAFTGGSHTNGSVVWTTGGDGNFNNNTLDNPTYTFGSSDLTGGVINLTMTVNGLGSCAPVSDVMQITVTPRPTANAAGDWIQCADDNTYTFSGASHTNGTVSWGTSGDGTFNNNTLDNPTYNISDNDTTNGSVTLTMTVTGNGSCAPVMDAMNITLTPIPIVYVSGEIQCADDPVFNLTGAVSHATGLSWSTDGDGSLVGGSTLTPTYTAGSNDITSGGVLITVTSTGNGGCNPVSETIALTITEAPSIDAGSDITACPDLAPITITGSVSVSSGVEWSIITGNGTIATTTALQTTYTPTSDDVTNGLVELQIESTGNGLCNPVTDILTIDFAPLPIVDAGNDTTVCFDATAIELEGSITDVPGGVWSVPDGNGNFSPNATTLITDYLLTSDDKQLGSFDIILTSVGGCIEVKDTMTVNVSAFVNAGIDTSVCVGTTSLDLEGTLSSPVSFQWTSSGDGSFNPDDVTLITTYDFGAQDISDQAFTIYLDAAGSGSCPAAKDSIQITIQDAPTLSVTYTDTTICKNVPSLDVSASYTQATGVIWSTSGTGIFTPSNDITNPTYELSSGDTALASVTLTVANVGACMPLEETIVIDYLPAIIVDAGTNQLVCKDVVNVSITGTVQTASGGTWSSPTGGTFGDENSLSTTYEPTTADTANGYVDLVLTSTGNLTCDEVKDTVRISFRNLPVANAGPDLVECALIQPIAISGSVQNASGVSWYTYDGAGTIDNSTIASTEYMPFFSDTINGGPVHFVLQTTGNGVCSADRDTFELSFMTAPYVYAGLDLTECIDITGVQISGDSMHVTGISWGTEGDGTFNNNTLINPVYVPSSNDTAAGYVDLVITGGGYATCPAATDTMRIEFNPTPMIVASSDQTVCANESPISISAVMNFADGVKWTSSGSGFFGNSVAQNTTYVPSDIDTATGVWLYVKTTGNGLCPEVRDSIEITFQPEPTADAGPDQEICVTQSSTTISGSYTGATGAFWSTMGSGSFDDINSLTTNYSPSPADTVAGTVILYLTTTGNGLCDAAVDQVRVDITPNLITADAGADALICGDSILLRGQVEVATGGIWSTPNGDGYFNPDETSLDVYYVFGPGDTTRGNVRLVLTTTGNGGCLPVKDDIVVTIQPPINVDAIISDSICAYPYGFPIEVNVSTDSIRWYTMGDGSFSPSSQDTSTNYIPGANDLASGQVILVAVSDNNGSCSPVTDTTVITFVELPVADYLYNPACALDDAVFTDASSDILGITDWWWEFVPGDTSVLQNPTYAFGQGDNYDVTLAVTSEFGCYDTVIKPILVNPVPLAGYISTARCYVDSAYFVDTTIIASGEIVAWHWEMSDGWEYDQPNVAHPFFEPATYSVTLTATSDSGCVGIRIDTIKVNAGPNMDFSFNNPCLEEYMLFEDQSTISDGNIIQWDWDFGDGNVGTGQNTSHLYVTDGYFDVELTAVTDSGCVDSILQQVKVNSLPEPAYNVDGICLEDGTQFIDQSTVRDANIVSWDWDFGDGGTSQEQDPMHYFPSTGTYQITYIVASDSGCVDTLTQSLTVNGSPTAAFTQSTDLAKPFWDIDFTDASMGAVQWSWAFGEGGMSSDENPTYAYSDTGSYTVTLIIENEFGCPDTALSEIKVSSGPIVPTGFSPNGDNHNDILYVRGGPYTDIDFKIYNNWGELIFQSYNQATGWDGTRNGVEQPIGVYVFTLTAKGQDGIEYKNMHGDITLLR